MSVFGLFVAAVVLGQGQGQGQGGGTPPHAGEVIFRSDFDDAGSLRAWEGIGQATRDRGPDGSYCLKIERSVAAGPGSVMVRAALPVDRLRGCRVQVEAQVRAADVARPPHEYNGVKVMLHIGGPGESWPQQNLAHGAFDWKPVGFRADVPREATSVDLLLGLEATTGRAWFDAVRVTVLAGPRTRPARTAARGPLDRRTSLPRLRGAMIGSVGADDLRTFGREWQANHVRWQLTWGGFPQSPADSATPAAYDAWFERELKRLDALLPVCAEAGIAVLVDLHTPPGGRDAKSACRLFQDRKHADHFLAVWERIARRYNGNPTVWGYDLVNEPVEGDVPAGLKDWHDLALEAARRVRAIDAEHALIVEPAPWGAPSGLEHFDPLPIPGVVYSVHMYEPQAFTHQGVYNAPIGAVYPGRIAGQTWNKERLRKVFRPVIEFQNDYHVPIYIGEFSAIRWAPDHSAYRYLRDVIDLMEEYGWDWAYHAFREWDGWSVEHGPDRSDRRRSPTATDRQQLLQSWFARNVKSPRNPR
jgi:endoglucanase